MDSIGGNGPFGQLTRFGENLFDRLHDGTGLAEDAQAFGQTALANRPPPAPAVDVNLSNEAQNTAAGALAGGKALSPVDRAFASLESDLTETMQMLGYSEQEAEQGASTLVDAAQEAYANGQSFSFTAAEVETFEALTAGAGGAKHYGELSARSLALYVDPASGTFAARAVSVEISQAASVSGAPAGALPSFDDEGPIEGGFDFGAILAEQRSAFQSASFNKQGSGEATLLERLLKQTREMEEQLEEARAQSEATGLPQQGLNVPAGLVPHLGDADIGSSTELGVLIARFDARIPLERPGTAQADTAPTSPPAVAPVEASGETPTGVDISA
mgnify:CR=1 FL=1